MLILTRKIEQGIVIDGHTVIRVLGVEGERVKIGIDAPPHVTVLREELLEEVAGENREASGAQGAEDLMERLRQLRRSSRS